MRKISILSILLTLVFSVSSLVTAQVIPVKPSVLVGEVSEISPSKIVLKTKDGAVDVILSDKTEYKRVSPEKPSLATATAATFADIGAGDKVAVTGILASDKKTIPARAVYSSDRLPTANCRLPTAKTPAINSAKLYFRIYLHFFTNN